MRHWWEQPLHTLDAQQWEALCDGCAKCCLHKLEDADTGEVFYTRIRCRYLLEESCRCSDYVNRSINVPDCVHLERNRLEEYHWLPQTCAYRLLHEGNALNRTRRS